MYLVLLFFKIDSQIELCGFENDCSNTLENLKDDKSYTVAAQCWTLVQAEAGDERGLDEHKQASSRSTAARQAT